MAHSELLQAFQEQQQQQQQRQQQQQEQEALLRPRSSSIVELRLLAVRAFNEVRGANLVAGVALDATRVRNASSRYRIALAAAAALLDTIEELHGVSLHARSLRVTFPDGGRAQLTIVVNVYNTLRFFFVNSLRIITAI